MKKRQLKYKEAQFWNVFKDSSSNYPTLYKKWLKHSTSQTPPPAIRHEHVVFVPSPCYVRSLDNSPVNFRRNHKQVTRVDCFPPENTSSDKTDKLCLRKRHSHSKLLPRLISTDQSTQSSTVNFTLSMNRRFLQTEFSKVLPTSTQNKLRKQRVRKCISTGIAMFNVNNMPFC